MSNKSKVVYFHPKPLWGTSGAASNIYRLEVKVIDTETFEEKYYLISPIKLISDILIKAKELPLENVKGVLFQFLHHDIQKETKIAKLLEAYYKQCNIQLFCCSANSVFYSSILHIMDEEGFGVEDCQSVIFIRDDQVRCITIKKNKDYYFASADNYFNAISFFEMMDPIILEKYITEPKVFVYFHMDESSQKAPDELQMKTFNQVSDYLKTKTFHVLTKNAKTYSNKVIVAKVLYFLGEKSVSKYNFACLTNTYFGLVAWENWLSNVPDPRIYLRKNAIIQIGEMELLPVKKTFVCYEPFEKLMCINSQGYKFEETPKISVSKIGSAVTFSVDKFLAPVLTVHQPEKVVAETVIIHFKDDTFSVEVIKNGKLEIIGRSIPVMICFANDKIVVGEDARQMKENYNRFVVSDLLKLLINDFKINHPNPEWGFRVMKNKEDQNFIVFETFRGQRKTTPTFLLSILIKWAISKAEIILEKQPDTVIIVVKRLYYEMKQGLINGCKGTKLEFKDVQIHRNKIVEIKEA